MTNDNPYLSDDYVSPVEELEEKKNHKRVIEIFVGLALIVFLIIMILLFVNLTDAKSTSVTATAISNSYNTNYVKPVPVNTYTQTVIVNQPASTYYKKTLAYSAESEVKISYSFSSCVNKYIVNVINEDCDAGYFSVRFYFTDECGRELTELVTHYLGPGEKKEFVYQTIYGDAYKNYKWSYKVISPVKTYDCCASIQPKIVYKTHHSGCGC